MRKLLLAAAAVFPFAVSPALADEYGSDHEGFRLGLDGVYADSEVILDGVGNPDSELNGAAFGVHAGYDLQIGDFVVGALATHTFGGPEETASPGLGIRQTTELDALTTFEARVGYAFDDLLVYAIGGAVKRDLEVSRCALAPVVIPPSPIPLPPSPVPVPPIPAPQACNPASVETLKFDETAPLFGAGVEWNVNDNVALNVSYVRAEFETESGRFGLALPFDVDQDLNLVRVSASYRF